MNDEPVTDSSNATSRAYCQHEFPEFALQHESLTILTTMQGVQTRRVPVDHSMVRSREPVGRYPEKRPVWDGDPEVAR